MSCRRATETIADDGDVIEVSAELVEETPEEPLSLGAPEPKVKESSSSAITHFDPLQAYLREVQRHPLLTPDEEHSLAVKYSETGDVEAAATLVSSNLRLVVKIAYEYRRAYRNIMDLIQEGNIGLMQAVKRYDLRIPVHLAGRSGRTWPAVPTTWPAAPNRSVATRSSLRVGAKRRMGGQPWSLRRVRSAVTQSFRLPNRGALDRQHVRVVDRAVADGVRDRRVLE